MAYTRPASGPEPSTALSRGPHHGLLRLAWRLLRHLDGHELAGARVEKRESHSDLRGTQRPHSQSILPHLPPRDCGPDHSRMFVRMPPATNQAKSVLTALP